MEPGEKYLSASFDAGYLIAAALEAICDKENENNKVSIAMYPLKDSEKKSENAPDFKNKGGALWVRQKKESKPKEEKI